jgi:hypothetical protein
LKIKLSQDAVQQEDAATGGQPATDALHVRDDGLEHDVLLSTKPMLGRQVDNDVVLLS